MRRGCRDNRRRPVFPSRQLQRTARERFPAPPASRPFGGLTALEDRRREETRRLAVGLTLAEHPLPRRDRDEDQILAVLGPVHDVEERLQLRAVAPEGAGAELRGEIDASRVDCRPGHAASHVAPTLLAASPISFQVVSSISIPSAMRRALAMRSGSPGTRTGSAGSAGCVAFI